MGQVAEAKPVTVNGTAFRIIFVFSNENGRADMGVAMEAIRH
jgi:hypothetical protein